MGASEVEVKVTSRVALELTVRLPAHKVLGRRRGKREEERRKKEGERMWESVWEWERVSEWEWVSESEWEWEREWEVPSKKRKGSLWPTKVPSKNRVLVTPIVELWFPPTTSFPFVGMCKSPSTVMKPPSKMNSAFVVIRHRLNIVLCLLYCY